MGILTQESCIGSMQQNYEPLRYKVFVVESKHPNVSLQSIMNNAVVRQTDIKGRGPFFLSNDRI